MSTSVKNAKHLEALWLNISNTIAQLRRFKKMVEQIRAVIQANLDEELEIHAFSVRVSEILKKFDGKKVTRRMRTSLSVAIPEHAMFYNTDFDQPKIIVNRIAGNPHFPHDDNKITYSLGGEWKNPNFNHDYFVNHSAICHLGAALERCEKRKELLEDSAWLMKTAKTIVDFIEAAKSFNEIANEDLPDRWAILQLVPFELKKV